MVIILTIIGLLALISLASLALSTDDVRQEGQDPEQRAMYLMRFGHH